LDLNTKELPNNNSMENFNNITRKAILIGCPGPSTNLLRGVKKDITNMSRFLRSDKGGAWRENEIITLANPKAADALSIVESAFADYVLVYFSGHGFTDRRNNSRMLALRDSNIPDWFLLNTSRRQLVIVDACRNFQAPGLAGTPEFDDQVDHFEGVSTYELFSECISHSQTGKLIIHATQPGKYSYDSSSGGLFTQALLHISTRMKANAEYSPCSISSILRHVPRLLQKNKNYQVPSITYSEGILSVPFALSTAGDVRSLSQKDSSGELIGAMLLTCVLVGVVVAVSN
jgi:hypothetical protein